VNRSFIQQSLLSRTISLGPIARAATLGQKSRFAPLDSLVSHSPIKTPILNRFGDVRGFDVFRAGEVGDRAAPEVWISS